MSAPQVIRIAHSPDSDDAFMFHALLHGAVDAEGLSFVAETRDTESLNALADEEDAVDVLAVSLARYATIADRYLLLPHGASVGRGYGPVVVAEGARALASLAGKRIAVPGLRTTAYLVLCLLLADFEPVVVPITPHDAVWQKLRAREVEAALVIHEGRLTYEREGFALVCDIGAAWTEAHGLPLPLGVNVIRRGLGAPLIEKVSRACSRSIAWALAHRSDLVRELATAGGPLDAADLDRYLAMYANADTSSMAPDVIRAVETLFAEAARRGLVAAAPKIELAP